MSATIDKAQPPTSREAAKSLKALAARLASLVDKLDRARDEPVSASAATQVSEIATALLQVVEPTPPSATAEKRAEVSPESSWPRDMAAGDASEPAWGRDPEGLRRG